MRKWSLVYVITTYTNDMQSTIKEYLQGIYSNKLGNPEEMNEFLDALDLPKLNWEAIDHTQKSTGLAE
jgi:hypothetical protein